MKEIIRKKNDPILRAKTEPVTEALPPAELKRIIEMMRATLEAEEDGVALAAPQVGLALRIFVVSPKANPEGKTGLPTVFINPRIMKQSRRQVELVEGCLSVRHIYGHIKRREKVTVEATDETGRLFTRHTSGLMAQIVQHEIDHLDGILFTDKAYDLTEVK
ncbi:MAG: peptide deformylase [Patescibacteria group bacterium]